MQQVHCTCTVSTAWPLDLMPWHTLIPPHSDKQEIFITWLWRWLLLSLSQNLSQLQLWVDPSQDCAHSANQISPGRFSNMLLAMIIGFYHKLVSSKMSYNFFAHFWCMTLAPKKIWRLYMQFMPTSPTQVVKGVTFSFKRNCSTTLVGKWKLDKNFVSNKSIMVKFPSIKR